jgi:catechol 2,3-dioxygenase-like lactoylglutathione lyase family enzyme
VNPRTLDHVALWVEDRDAIAAFATAHLGMHVIDETDRFTLIGSDARRGKLTLFAAEGAREPGALRHVALRVSSLERAQAALPSGIDPSEIDLGEGLRIVLVEAPTDVEYDLDHVALLSADPERTAAAYERLGFDAAPAPASGVPRVTVGGAFVEFHPGEPGDPARPLLNHLAVLVDSAEEHRQDADDLGVEVADFVDAPNTLAVFVWGPERVKIEYVEHKPSFSLT